MSKGMSELVAEREALERELTTNTVEARLAAVNSAIAERERQDAERAERERLARVAELEQVRERDAGEVVEALLALDDALGQLAATEDKLRGEHARRALSDDVPGLVREAVREAVRWYREWRPHLVGLPARRTQHERQVASARAQLEYLKGLEGRGVYREPGDYRNWLDRALGDARVHVKQAEKGDG